MSRRRMKCSICHLDFDEGEMYEYRGAVSCEKDFDKAIEKRDWERAEVIAENRHQTKPLGERIASATNNQQRRNKMATRAKFVVTNKEDTIASGSTVRLSAVTSGSAENEDFYKYTPSGQITLSTINEKAASEFKVGSFYYVDFTEVPE